MTFKPLHSATDYCNTAFMKKILSCILIILLIAVLIPDTLFSAPKTPAPLINAESAILIDAETGKVLFEKNADNPVPPASMTKLMTLYVISGFIKDGKVSPDTIVPISENADFRNLPPRSSLMFIEQGQTVTLMELMQGLALPSGNDAGIAVAEFLAGSVENFVGLMNKEAERLGMNKTHFDDSSGLSEKNITTAREYASFCRTYIDENREYVDKLHTERDFTYPKTDNLPPSGESVYGPITQPNHNLLIGRMPGVDGLKTGYIDESGYNFAVTAEQNGRRLILVTLGGPGTTASDGGLRRAFDAAVLLTYGFHAWTDYTPVPPGDVTIPLRGAAKPLLGVRFSMPTRELIETAAIDELEFKTYYNDIRLPVTAGSIIGRWELHLGNNEVLQSGILTAAENIDKGTLLKRLLDWLRY